MTVIGALGLDQRIAATVAGLILFAPASVALGMVSPYAARLAMHTVGSSGTTVGTLYAASTVGSIVGTFLTGWVLLGYLGTTSVLYLLAAITLVVSFAIHTRVRRTSRVLTLVVIAALAIGAASEAERSKALGYIDTDTRYQRAIITEGYSADSGRAVRYLRTDPLGAQSAVYADGSTELVAKYTRVFGTLTASLPPPQRTLTLGGGAQVWPSYFIDAYPDAVMDVIEIDPGLIPIAVEHFGFVPDARLAVIHEDARTYLNRTQTAYDIIYADAFSGTSIPVQLTTRESVMRMRNVLSPGGVVIANIITPVDGADAALMRSMLATYRSVFPFVAVIPVLKPSEASRMQNVLFVAASDPVGIPESLAGFARTDIDTDDALILTDEFAPVEHLAAGLR
jgi:spermidine synthase